MSTTAKPRKTDYFEWSFESETKPYNWLVIRIFQRNPTQNNRQPNTQNLWNTRGRRVIQCLCTGLMHLSALTFGTLLSSQESDAHRASHSRSKLRGNPPNFTVPTRAGQIGSFRSSLPARLSVRNPPRRVSASETFREFVRGPAASASCASLQQEGHYWHSRCRCKSGSRTSSEPPGTCPRHRSSGVEGSSADPSGHSTRTRLRERHFHHAVPTQVVFVERPGERHGGSRIGSHLSRTAPPSRRLSASGRS